jgi:hypothetical protein
MKPEIPRQTAMNTGNVLAFLSIDDDTIRINIESNTIPVPDTILS